MKLSKAPRMAAFAILVGLAACSHSSSEAVTDLSSDLKASSFVSQIKIKAVPPEAPAAFEANLGGALQSALAKCANGSHALTLEVTVTKFQAENAAMTILVGSSNAVQGSARLVQPDTGAVVGDYDIAASTGGGGVIAAIAMADAQSDMSNAFASDICKKAFGHRPGSNGATARVASITYSQPSVPWAAPAVSAADSRAPYHAAPDTAGSDSVAPGQQGPWHEAPSP